MSKNVRRLELWYANLSPVVGCEQDGIRPVVVIQNEIGNTYSKTTIVSIITSRIRENKLPTHVYIDQHGLECESVIMFEHIRTIDKKLLVKRIGKIEDEKLINQIKEAIQISLDI